MSWPFDPTVYAGLALGVLGYGALARGCSDFRPRQAVCFAGGILTIWIALETPIDVAGDHYLQSAHMLQHVLIGMVAPPLLLLGLSPAMAAAVARLPGLRGLAEPIPAQVGFGVVMGVWHLPAVYGLTLQSEVIHVFEHLTFMAAGCLFWWPVITNTSALLRWRLGDAGRVLYLIFGTVPADTVSVILMFSRAPLYGFYSGAPRLLPAVDPLTDQVLAGVVLMVIGKVSFLVAILEIGLRWVARARREEAAEATAAGPR